MTLLLLLAGQVQAQDLTLTVSPMVASGPVTLEVTGAEPGARVVLAKGQRVGPGPCPGPLNGACLGIQSPKILTEWVADGSGTAGVTINLPARFLPGTPFIFQAASPSAGPGRVSNVVSTSVVGTGGPAGLPGRPSNTTCDPLPRPAASISLDIEWPYNVDFTDATELEKPPGVPSHWYVLEQAGLVHRFPAVDGIDNSDVDVVLDLMGVVDQVGEMGLLGMAFHPDFATNGELYLFYSANSTSHVARFVTANGGASFTPDGVIWSASQYTPYHNGGDIDFGPDGYLYISVGEDDLPFQARDPNNPYGKILRIDVDGAPPYEIPPDNPFIGGGSPEVFAYGLRNPWRMSFDSVTGDLWVGDVGDSAWEEVNLVTSGGNYGWDIKEGFDCTDGTQDCQGLPGLIDPVAVYGRDMGVSVIGGVVYHGAAIPELLGTYVFTDWIGSQILGLVPDGPSSYALTDLGPGGGAVAVTTDEDGEIYMIAQWGGIRRLVPGAGGGPVFPDRLSLTGCADPGDPTLPSPGMIPYDVNAPLWSDGAVKSRWLAMPDGTRASVGPDGDIDLPTGTVLRKDFEVNGILTETRLLVRHTDGGWAGYSYAWNAGLTDALWVPGGATADVDGQTWVFPSTAQCAQCHTEAAGHSLGAELGQLDGDFTYPSTGVTANQVDTWENIGLFDVLLPRDHVVLPTYDGAGTDAQRARSYLHSNCSHCHRPGGPGRGPADFLYTSADPGICNVPPTLGDMGIPGAQLFAPGDPASSIVLQRMLATDSNRMPPVGSLLVDPEGTTLVQDWILGTATCPP